MLDSIVFCIFNLDCTTDFCAFPITFHCKNDIQDFTTLVLHTTFGLKSIFIENWVVIKPFFQLFYNLLTFFSEENETEKNKTSFNIRHTWTKERIIILIHTICLKQIHKLSIVTVCIYMYIYIYNLFILITDFFCQLHSLISQSGPHVHSRMSAGVFFSMLTTCTISCQQGFKSDIFWERMSLI